MRPDRFPKVNDVMLAEALRQILPLAEGASREVFEKWADRAVQRADITLKMWVKQKRGRDKLLDGELPPPAKFLNAPENPDRPDPGQTIPAECRLPKRPKPTSPP